MSLCARTFICTLSPLWLVGRSAVSYLSINIMFYFSGFIGFGAVLFSKAGGYRNDICRTLYFLCVNVLKCLYLMCTQDVLKK